VLVAARLFGLTSNPIPPEFTGVYSHNTRTAFIDTVTYAMNPYENRTFLIDGMRIISFTEGASFSVSSAAEPQVSGEGSRGFGKERSVEAEYRELLRGFEARSGRRSPFCELEGLFFGRVYAHQVMGACECNLSNLISVTLTSSRNRIPAMSPIVESTDPTRHGSRYGYFRRISYPSTEG
jgi:hypothetical protein